MLERIGVLESQHQRTDVLTVNGRAASSERLCEEVGLSLKVLAAEALRKRDADRASPAVPNRRADPGNHRTIRVVSRNAQTDPRRDCGPTPEDVTRDIPLPLLIRPPGHPTHRDCDPDA